MRIRVWLDAPNGPGTDPATWVVSRDLGSSSARLATFDGPAIGAACRAAIAIGRKEGLPVENVSAGGQRTVLYTPPRDS